MQPSRKRGCLAGRQGISALLCALLSAHPVLADRVVWSDGRTLDGTLEAGEGAAIRLHDGRQILGWGTDEVADIAFTPVTQQMERAWQFVEAGKTAKTFSGLPYPTLELQAEVMLRDGRVVRGHVMTTVLYLTHDTRTEKLVLKYKLRGEEGQAFTNLVYPQKLIWAARPAAGGAHAGAVQVTVAHAGVQDELAVVSRAKMTEAEVRRTAPGTFRATLDGGDAVTAVRHGARIAVGWRGAAPETTRLRIAQGLSDLKDFFDVRQLLAVSQETHDATTCHTLLLLSRAGGTTLNAAASQPWRLEVWKWRLGETNDLTAASRCVLFRGLRAPEDPLPTVWLDAGLQTVERLTDGLVLQVQAAVP